MTSRQSYDFPDRVTGDCCIFMWLVWREIISCVFRLRPSFSNSSGVEWTGRWTLVSDILGMAMLRIDWLYFYGMRITRFELQFCNRYVVFPVGLYVFCRKYFAKVSVIVDTWRFMLARACCIFNSVWRVPTPSLFLVDRYSSALKTITAKKERNGIIYYTKVDTRCIVKCMLKRLTRDWRVDLST